MCMLTAMYPTRVLLKWEKLLGQFFLTELMLQNSKANRDGCGYATVDGYLKKWPAPFEDVVYTGEQLEALEHLITKPTLAHVRAASTGFKADDKAHPYQSEHIIVAHNGTFNHKKVQKEMGIEGDYVDTEVFTKLLAQKADGKALTPEHIKAAIKEMPGSYALLIIDLLTENFWVVRGGCSLYLKKVGPFWVINTSEANLNMQAAALEARGGLLFKGREITTGKSEIVGFRTINLLTRDGLEKVMDLPYTTVVTSPTKWQQGYRHGGLATAKGISTAEAMQLAETHSDILDTAFIGRSEVVMACFTLFQKDWYECTPMQLLALEETFTLLAEDYGNCKKESLWKQVRDCVRIPYNELSEVKFPYFLHSVEELEALVVLAKERKDGLGLITP